MKRKLPKSKRKAGKRRPGKVDPDSDTDTSQEENDVAYRTAFKVLNKTPLNNKKVKKSHPKSVKCRTQEQSEDATSMSEEQPMSKYNRKASTFQLKTWRPVIDPESNKYREKFGLKSLSCVCVDLVNFPGLFPKKSGHSPLASSKIKLSQSLLELLKRQEVDKRRMFENTLNQRVAVFAQESSEGIPEQDLSSSGRNMVSSPEATFTPMSQYKIHGSVADVRKEVEKLLSRKVEVGHPEHFETAELKHYLKFLVKKMAWWLLKCEEDPPVSGRFHPESENVPGPAKVPENGDEDYSSDDSSSGFECADDPFGTSRFVLPNYNRDNDPNYWEEYCGQNLVSAKIRRIGNSSAQEEGPFDLTGPFHRILEVPRNKWYGKPGFSVRCRICNETMTGEKNYAVHLRSDDHKNRFKNLSLEMANYEESVEVPVLKKVFTAKLEQVADSSESTGDPTVRRAPSEISSDSETSTEKTNSSK